jgi:4-amino-4-deoxy-L-arabinose transferase-like glycosyltransferase
MLKSRLWFLLFLSTVLWTIGSTELAHDEAYYWMWSRHLDWSYFDHPPLIAWLISLTATWIPGEWGVRLGPSLFLIAVALGAGRALVPIERQWQWWAGWMLFPLLNFIAGFATPDTALLASGLLFIWSVHSYLERDSWPAVLALAASSAFLLYAKYHGVFLIAGLVFALPEILKRRSFWCAALIGLVLYLPHIVWQWQHDFITLRFHLFQAHRAALSLLRPLEYIWQQAFAPGVLLAPWVWVRASKGWRASRFDRALGGMTVMTLGVLFIFSFTQKMEGNWTAAAYLPLLLLATRAPGEWPLHKRWFQALGGCSVIVVVGIHLIMGIPASTSWVRRLGELHGWRAWASKVAKSTEGCELVTNRYQLAAKLSFYLGKEIPSLNIQTRSNQFDLWHLEKGLEGKPLCWLSSRREFPGTVWVMPDGKKIRLSKGLTLDQIRSLNKSNP